MNDKEEQSELKEKENDKESCQKVHERDYFTEWFGRGVIGYKKTSFANLPKLDFQSNLYFLLV